MQVAILLWRQHRQISRLRTQGGFHQCFSQVVTHRLAVLGDHSRGIQDLTKDIAGKCQQVIGAIVT